MMLSYAALKRKRISHSDNHLIVGDDICHFENKIRTVWFAKASSGDRR